jgi:hypothetical protein
LRGVAGSGSFDDDPPLVVVEPQDPVSGDSPGSAEGRSCRSRPVSVRELVEAAEALAAGQKQRRLPLPDDPELARLARAVNDLADRLVREEALLAENVRSLQESNRRLRRAQETLVRTEKLATVGRLVAGVAHEIGNPLGAILGYLDLLRRTGGMDEEARTWMSRVEDEARRIDRIVRELLDFARPAPMALQPVDVNEVVESALSLLGHQRMFAKMRLERELFAGLPPARAERHRLQQVLVNLLLNACDAMPEGGTIRVRTELATAPFEELPAPPPSPRRRDDPPEADFSHLRPRLSHDATPDRPFSSEREWVRIVVSDGGSGIPPEDLQRVFDPFFTTKPPGKGTGLGLAISLATVQAFRGRLQIASKVGAGTTVTVELPVAR